MEKLMYAVWMPDAMAVRDFRHTFLGDTARALLGLGVRGLAINLADDLAVPGLRIERLNPTGTVSIWVDTALSREPIERTLGAATARLAGWLVLESVPLVNTRHVVPLGERLPGPQDWRRRLTAPALALPAPRIPHRRLPEGL